MNETANESTTGERSTGPILCIGGVLFRGEDGTALHAWYGEHLGMPTDMQGFAVPPWIHLTTGGVNSTTCSPFPRDSESFDHDQRYMVNHIADDLDAALSDLRAAGARIDDDKRIEAHDYGGFACSGIPKASAPDSGNPIARSRRLRGST